MGLFSSATESKLKSKKLKTEGCVVTLQIEVPEGKFKETTQNMLVRLQGQAKVPGFRPGKAPLDVVEKYFGGRAKEDALDRILKESVSNVLEEHKIDPVATPKVHSLEMNPGKPVHFQLEVETQPVFQVKDYKKIPVTRKKYPASEKGIDQRIEDLREGNSRLENAPDESVSKSHYVVLDFEGTSEGKPLPGGKRTDQIFDMSAPGAMEGLSEGLLGAKRGETRTVNVDLQGKKAQLKCSIKEIKNKILPKLDDEFAKDLGYQALGELKEQIKKVIEDEGQRKTDHEVMEQIQEGLLKSNKFPVPPTLVEHETSRTLERLRNQILGPRKDWPEGEQAKLREKLKPKAESDVRLSYVFQAVADVEKIDATPEDLEAEKAKNLESAADEAEKKQILQLFENRGETIKAMIRERKVVDFLKNSAVITEA